MYFGWSVEESRRTNNSRFVVIIECVKVCVVLVESQEEKWKWQKVTSPTLLFGTIHKRGLA